MDGEKFIILEKKTEKVIKNSVSEFSRHQERSSNTNPRTVYEIQRHP